MELLLAGQTLIFGKDLTTLWAERICNRNKHVDAMDRETKIKNLKSEFLEKLETYDEKLRGQIQQQKYLFFETCKEDE